MRRYKLSLLVMLIVITTVFMSGCPTTRDLIINVYGEGTTEPTPGTHTYDVGKDVTITAIGTYDEEFTHWEGDASGTSPNVTITMDSDKAITAYFGTREPERRKVYIDAGHGGHKKGTYGYDDMERTINGELCEWKYDDDPDIPNEADINLKIAMRLRSFLRNEGLDVVMSRTTDEHVDIHDRYKQANRENCDILVSIHNNVDGCDLDDTQPDDDGYGTETFYKGSDNETERLASKRLANEVQAKLVWATGLWPREIKETRKWPILTEAKMPAVLVEVAFLTNKTDFNYIRYNTWSAALGIAEGILNYFGEQSTFQAHRASPTADIHTLRVSIVPQDSGSVTPSRGNFTSLTVVTLSANPGPEFVFDHWEGDASGTSPNVTITMDSDKTITALFLETATLTIAIDGLGTTHPSPGTHTYDKNAVVDITATPASGSRFDHWEGDASGTSPNVTITMDGDKTITAHFIVSDVQITKIHYDGSVPRVESDEYVEITNLGNEAQDLAGWILKDVSDGYPVFVFPSYILAPRESIRVYTNEIHPESGGFSFGYRKAIWNNTTPDTAVLYDSQRRDVSRKSY